MIGTIPSACQRTRCQSSYCIGALESYPPWDTIIKLAKLHICCWLPLLALTATTSPPKKKGLSHLKKHITGIASNKHLKNVTRQKRECVNSSFFGLRFHKMLYDTASSKGPLPFTMINAWRISRLNPGSDASRQKSTKTSDVVLAAKKKARTINWLVSVPIELL